MKDEQRPTGFWFSGLYDSVSKYSDNPIKEIERLTKEALDRKVIDERRYIVVQYRLPFSGTKKETLKQVGNRLNVCGERVRELEGSICLRFARNFPKIDF